MDLVQPPPIVWLTDAACRNVVLTDLVKMLHQPDEARLEELVSSGITPQLMDRLYSLTACDLMRVANMPLCRIGVHIDWTSFARALDVHQAAKHASEILEYFIRHGASRRLLRRLFSLSDAEYRSRAMALGLDPCRRGRVPMPAESERDAIGLAWHALTRQHAADPRRCYYELHRRFSACSIAALEQVLFQFEALQREAR
ncbi:MAG TPA: STY4526/YPO1902 family pathogenicity island replication protein [Burkholderiaceae bacterium]|nr:STY4526/YPO1902 family pathogenicity island replication protein [Burkholderiaceae bacterium]